MSLSTLGSAFNIDPNSLNIGVGIAFTPNVRFTINNGNPQSSWKTTIIRSSTGNHLTLGTYEIDGYNNPYIASIDKSIDTFRDLYINNLGNQNESNIGNVIINGKTIIGNNSNTIENNHILDVYSKKSNDIAIFRTSNLELKFHTNSNINISTNNKNLNINSSIYVSEFISINSNNYIPNSNEKLMVNGIAIFNSNIIINGKIGGNFTLDSDNNFSERNKLPASYLNIRTNSGITSNINNELFIDVNNSNGIILKDNKIDLNIRANSGITSNINNELFIDVDNTSGILLNNNKISLNPIIPNIQTYGKIVLGDITNDVSNYSLYVNSNSKFNKNVVIGNNPTSTSLNINDYILNINGNIGITGNIFNASDSKLKKNIETYPNALEKIMKCRGVLYELNENNKKNIGVIAQEIEEIIPEIIETTSSGIKNVNYLGLIPILIEAIKELNNKKNI